MKMFCNSAHLTTLIVIALLMFEPVSAATIQLRADLDCVEAGTCGAGGTGTGLMLATLDDQTNLLSWDFTWSGLSGTLFVSHFHGPSATGPGPNAPIQVSIDVSSNPAIGSEVISASQVSELLSGLWYVNMHTSTFTPGEIRGQVSVVPLPGAAWLFSFALATLGWMRRKNAS